MTQDPARPARAELTDGLEVSRIVTGLWQMADQERDGAALDLDRAAEALADYAEAGFDSFDMADHYGSAEIVAGRASRLLRERGAKPPVILTKWVPEPGPMSAEVVRAGVERALERLDLPAIDVMQFHWWAFDDPGYLAAMAELMKLKQEGLVRHLGLTNFDTGHLRVLVKNGIEIASNQVSFSLLDRRAGAEMSAFCLEHGVRLLAYGTLAGGFLSERWLARPEPRDIPDWSKMKYKRFIDAAGGWEPYQGLLRAMAAVAARHGVSLANVATRWVLEHPAVAAVIVGARLGEHEHRADNLKLFSFQLDDVDRAALAEAFDGLTPIPGDCGDEYRKPPFLTASGDLSHHLNELPPLYDAAAVPARPGRGRVSSGSEWEAACGFSRAVRVGNRVLVSGTTATGPAGEVVCPGDVEGQATFILDKIAAALKPLGASLDDVVRTRIYLKDQARWAEAGRAHGRAFAGALPANTLVEVANLVGDYEIEIEAEAVIG